MAGHDSDRLLGRDDPAPIGVFNAEGSSPFLLLGDHAGSAVPRGLKSLGLPPAELRRHIALDIGIYGVGLALATLLDAPFLHQAYSRLVIDCNRDPGRPDAMPEVSDNTPIPGNRALSAQAREQRIAAIQRPYHAAIAAALTARRAAARETVILSLHSFTPVMEGIARPWDVGVLFSAGEIDFARALLASLRNQPGIEAGENVPYAMDSTDYTVPRHAFPAGLPYAEIEVRQDLLQDELGQRAWAERLEAAAREALRARGGGGDAGGALPRQAL